jgi:hypothetical protein
MAKLVVTNDEVAEAVHGFGAAHTVDDLQVDAGDAQSLHRPALAVIQVDDALVAEDLRLLCREREDAFRCERALKATKQKQSRRGG